MQIIENWVLGAKTTRDLNIGRKGENLVSRVALDAGNYISVYGEGSIQVRHQRPNDVTPYPVAELSRDGDIFYWTITSGDTAEAGCGLLEVRWYVGDALKISQTRKTFVEPVLCDESGTPPDVWEGYLDRIHRSGAAVEEAAQEAIRQFDEDVARTTEETVALVEKTGANQVSNVKAQEKKSIQAVKEEREAAVSEIHEKRDNSLTEIQEAKEASLFALTKQQMDSQDALEQTLYDAQAAGIAAIKEQENASVAYVSEVGGDYVEKARQIAVKNGFAAFDMDDDGFVWLSRTSNIVDRLDFEITQEGNLEVIISG